MLKRKVLCRVLLLFAVGAAIFAAAVGAAQADITVTVGQPSLSSSRVLITVPVTVSCSPFDPSLTFTNAGISVTTEQAAGTRIATGAGSVGGNFYPGPFVFLCDGSNYTVPVSVLAAAPGPPFHGGPAAFSASAFADAANSCGPGCFYDFVFQSATTTVTRSLH
jgi:hypothetical protein